MNCEEEVLVGSGPNHVCSCEEFPGQHGSIAEEVGAEDLKRHDSQNDIFGQWLRSTELGDLNTQRRELLVLTVWQGYWNEYDALLDGL